MPKRIDKQDLDKIAALLATHKAGLSIAELERVCKTERLDFDRRTLQRRLAELIKLSRVLKEGKGRASRYLLAPITGDLRVVLPPTQLVAHGEIYVPLSPLGAEVKGFVRRPITARTPVAEQAAGTYPRDILNRLMIDLSWSSSRLEGNTYSRLETQNLIEFGHAADGKDQREAEMILNHKAAIEMLVEHAEEIGFDTFTFFNLHALLSENLLMDPDASGRLRTTIIEISGSVFHPLAVTQQIEDSFRLILDKTNAIRDPFEQAFFLMVHIPYLQPFLDVNKRVSRLGANIPLIKHNLSPLSFVDVPEQAYVDGTLGVYEFNRVELLQDVFVWAYERSCQRS